MKMFKEKENAKARLQLLMKLDSWSKKMQL